MVRHHDRRRHQRGGPHAPYRQSERKEIYLKYALQLVGSGDAYYAFDTPDELNAIRAEAEAAGKTFAYNYEVRTRLATSLALSDEEVKRRIAAGDQWVIRFKMPENEEVRMHDLIRGDVTVHTSTLDDKVLYKSADALPTYHLANIVDDHLMEISHVIRGEEWLPSLPLHYLLYRALGWSDTQPEFAHLPLLLKPTGGGKLSKRDGDKMGFPVFPLQWTSPEGETSHGYREDGYFPEAFVNMLALLGWNPGTDQEIFSMDELIGAFSLERVSKSGARFNPEKAHWFNAQYLHAKSDAELAALYAPILKAKGGRPGRQNGPGDRADQTARDIRQRFLESNLVHVRRAGAIRPQIDRQILERRKSDADRSTADAAGRDRRLLEREHRKNRIRMDRAKRISDGTGDELVPTGHRRYELGPSILDICEIIGKEETLRRIDKALETLR